MSVWPIINLKVHNYVSQLKSGLHTTKQEIQSMISQLLLRAT